MQEKKREIENNETWNQYDEGVLQELSSMNAFKSLKGSRELWRRDKGNVCCRFAAFNYFFRCNLFQQCWSCKKRIIFDCKPIRIYVLLEFIVCQSLSDFMLRFCFSLMPKSNKTTVIMSSVDWNDEQNSCHKTHRINIFLLLANIKLWTLLWESGNYMDLSVM